MKARCAAAVLGGVLLLPRTSAGESAAGWAASASTLFYFLPDSAGFEQPTLTLDWASVHLEGRYNYEDLRTASAWAGLSLSGTGEVEWSVTPMLGAVFGATRGIAPGLRGSLAWWKLELYSESEYVVGWGSASADFFYNWSELSVAPVEALRLGLVTQRTRAYESARELGRGPLIGVSYGLSSLTLYVLDPDTSDVTIIVGVGLALEP
jgi:hypothetical protein